MRAGWYKGDKINIRGICYDQLGVQLDHDLISKSLGSLKTEESVRLFLKSIIGNFSLMFETESHLYCLTDLIASTPLFYFLSDSAAHVSDDIYELYSVSGSKIDNELFEELYTFGYVLGGNTLCEGIRKMSANSLTIFRKSDQSVTSETVKTFENRISPNIEKNELFGMIQKSLSNAFNRMLESLDGKHIVVPLSGGFDSRLLVCELKSLGVSDLTCFTYGEIDDYDVRESKRVAGKLGYKWLFIEYTETIWKNFVADSQTADYLNFAGQLNTLPHFQDFIAVKYLKENELIPENSVIIAGHTGDLLGGKQIPVEIVESKSQNWTVERFNKLLLRKHANYGFVSQKITRRLRETILERNIYPPHDGDEDSFIRALDIWNFYERQQKFIINSVRVYEFFGYEWRLPLWDSEIADLWYGMPSVYRKNKTLYNDYLNEQLFAEFELGKRYKHIRERGVIGLSIKGIARLGKDVMASLGIIKRSPFLKFFRREVKLEFRYYRQKALSDRDLMAQFTLYYNRIISKL